MTQETKKTKKPNQLLEMAEAAIPRTKIASEGWPRTGATVRGRCAKLVCWATGAANIL